MDIDQIPHPVAPESSWIDWINRSGIDIPDDPVDAAQAILDATERKWWIRKYVVPHMREFEKGGPTGYTVEVYRHWMAGGSTGPQAVAELLGLPLGEAKYISDRLPACLDNARRDWVLDLMIDNPELKPAEILELCQEFCPPPNRDTVYGWRDTGRSYRVSQIERRRAERGLRVAS